PWPPARVPRISPRPPPPDCRPLRFFATRRACDLSRAMEKMYQKYPDDREAAAFYALSLLASEPDNDTTFANRKKAAEVHVVSLSDRKSTRLNSSHGSISYTVFCFKKKKTRRPSDA